MGIPHNTTMKGHSRHNSSLIGRKCRAKFENDRISRNGHRIKITQPNWMIEVSFSSAEDTLHNDVKILTTFCSQCTENPPFRFLWDTRYMLVPHHRNPLFREKFIPPYLGYWLLPLAITKKTPFSGFSREIDLPETTVKKIPPFPEKMGMRMRPPHAFEWGGGGGRCIK